MSDIHDIHQQIAADFAGLAWGAIGTGAGHGALYYGAHKLVNLVDGPKEGFFSKLNPLPKFKKLIAWTGLEAATHSLHPVATEYWDTLKPAAKEFLTPVIKSISKPLVEFLVDRGYLKYAEAPVIEAPAAMGWGEWLAYPITAPISAISSWFEGGTPEPVVPATPNIDPTFLQITERYAPVAGQWIAQGLDATYHYAGQIAKGPSDLIETLAEHLGVPYHVALLGTTAVGFLAYYGLKAAASNVYQTVVQTQNTNVSNSNNVTFVVQSPGSDPVATPTSTSPKSL